LVLEQDASHKAALQALVAWLLAQAETPWERAAPRSVSAADGRQ
jgi:hypothetical protein